MIDFEPLPTTHRNRPRWALLYLLVLILNILVRAAVLAQLAPLFGQAMTRPTLAAKLIATALMIVLAAVAVAGLWRMTRWGFMVGVLECVLEIALVLFGIATGSLRDIILLVCFAAVLALFWRDRTAFMQSPEPTDENPL